VGEGWVVPWSDLRHALEQTSEPGGIEGHIDMRDVGAIRPSEKLHAVSGIPEEKRSRTENPLMEESMAVSMKNFSSLQHFAQCCGRECFHLGEFCELPMPQVLQERNTCDWLALRTEIVEERIQVSHRWGAVWPEKMLSEAGNGQFCLF
jgi:hypothetical protein